MRALNPDNIPIEVWKHLKDKGVVWMTKLFNGIMMSRRMLAEWRNKQKKKGLICKDAQTIEKLSR